MNKKRCLLLCSFILVLVFITACKSISRDEAIDITKDFVNSQVKFFVSEDDEKPLVPRVNITILNTEKNEGDWFIYLNVKSEVDNETKQSDVVVVLNGRDGAVKDLRRIGRPS